jgi:hypothetical protein
MSGEPAGQPDAAATISNPRDIQGILALAIVIGFIIIAAAVIFAHVVTDPTAIITALSTLTASVVSFYFGMKSQQ